MADVFHMQTLHHYAYAELAEGIRVGLRAADNRCLQTQDVVSVSIAARPDLLRWSGAQVPR